MKDWRSIAKVLVSRADRLSDAARARLKRITGYRGPLIIQPFLGYGGPERLFLQGRVLEDEGFVPSRDADTAFRNLLNMYRRFESDEVPGAILRVRFRDGEHRVSQQQATADNEGYFSVELQPSAPVTRGSWHNVELELLHPRPRNGRAVRATGRVLVPAASARFGIISDIDDTVISTHVTRKLTMLLTVLLSNEHTRLPFKGVAELYRALHAGAGGREQNPVFYVSGSPWNLYTLLVEFLRVRGIPEGPLLLRDFGDEMLFGGGSRTHKQACIDRVLNTYPELKFVLIGDSGEQDPEIYSDIVRRHPDRVRVIYIRSIDRRPQRLAAIDRLIGEVRLSASQLVLVPDSEFAAAHAAAEGLISTRALAALRA
jgi:phosphatidate phosphatase APP1